ncbi:hypothetical protein Salat_2872000 [Sesamum alatum]|uniref:Uncharacterized protein n=1 Tax=Sesamum alatum TaxID=300844 RepID=A0AAE2CAB1_9LAMI|nr:hypothetical protein Salat_2872000 [Sesamum alatum]
MPQISHQAEVSWVTPSRLKLSCASLPWRSCEERRRSRDPIAEATDSGLKSPPTTTAFASKLLKGILSIRVNVLRVNSSLDQGVLPERYCEAYAMNHASVCAILSEVIILVVVALHKYSADVHVPLQGLVYSRNLLVSAMRMSLVPLQTSIESF